MTSASTPPPTALPSPFAVIAIRARNPAVPASLFTGPVQASFLTLQRMRKTLHTLPLPLVAAAHATTLDSAIATPGMVLYADRTATAVDRVVDQLCVLLQDGLLPRDTIEPRLAAGSSPVPAYLNLSHPEADKLGAGRSAGLFP